MMTFADGWSSRADFQGPARSLKQYPTNASSAPHQPVIIPEAIIMRRSKLIMNNLRLRSQKKVLPSMSRFLKASKL